MKQLTKKEAIEIHDSEIWKTWTKEKIAYFQLKQDRLCVPFDVFHESVEYCLKRPVYTHEFGSLNREGLIAELEEKKVAPTIDEIIGMLPKDKTIIIKSKLKDV